MNYLIIGGTGTLGRALTARLHKKNNITILSRDEFKQAQMKKEYPSIKFVLGDVRNKDDLNFEDWGMYHKVFHTAALKHVDIGEFQTDQFIKTNLNGTINVGEKCVRDGTKLVFFSTDKAVLPINAYGMTKALAEKWIQANVICNLYEIYRWGNILGSRGSIVPFFAKKIVKGEKIPITHEKMTRFWLNIEEAVDFVLAEKEVLKKVYIPDVKAAPVKLLAECVANILGYEFSYEDVGIRPGEKIHEHLYTDHDYCISSDKCAQYTKEELIIKIKELVY